MKLWFAQLVPREQKLVLFGGGLLLITLLYLLLIEPALLAREQRQNSVKALQQELLWMQQAKVEALSLGAGQNSGSQNRSNGQAPYIIVDAAIRRARLGTPERIDPQGKKGTKVQFSEVNFNQLITMLTDLEMNHGLRVSNANFSKQQTGTVKARVSLERFGK